MNKPGINTYSLFFFALFALLLVPLAAQINQSELDSLGSVEFVNYEGPYTIIETRAQIRNIGYTLGQAVRNGAANTGTGGRYFVIHAAGGDGLKLDADIFGLGVDVGVDHVRNLRLIIQGYLEAAYGYAERDAALLAEYITVYNAVYRGDADYFDSRYKKQVLDNITREKAGLSLRFDEWPGQTLMLIPLGTTGLSSIDTTSITDSRVTESLRQEPDASIQQRQDMVDLKEREAEEASQQAAVAREAIRQEEERIARERLEAQQQEEEARRRQQLAQQQEQQARQQEQQARDEQQRQLAQQQQQEAQRQQQLAQQQQQEAQQRQEQLDRQQQAAEEQRREAERQQAFAEQKDSEAQQERREIAMDQQALIDQQALAARQTGGILGILIQDSSLGRLVKLDPATGRETLRSALSTINARTVTLINNRIIALAGESGAVRLVEIDSDTLAMRKQGEDEIAGQSLLWINGQDLYAICSSGDGLYLARFNMDLVLQARSMAAVHPLASAFFSDGYIATQRADGSALLLNARDLTERR